MDHKDLDVWKKSMDLVESIYKWTEEFPSAEKYGLVAQIRRSVISVPSNIAEGSARKGDKELIQFINIAIGSMAELKTQYLIAIRLEIGLPQTDLSQLIMDVKKLLLGYRNYVINKKI